MGLSAELIYNIRETKKYATLNMPLWRIDYFHLKLLKKQLE